MGLEAESLNFMSCQNTNRCKLTQSSTAVVATIDAVSEIRSHGYSAKILEEIESRCTITGSEISFKVNDTF